MGVMFIIVSNLLKMLTIVMMTHAMTVSIVEKNFPVLLRFNIM